MECNFNFTYKPDTSQIDSHKAGPQKEDELQAIKKKSASDKKIVSNICEMVYSRIVQIKNSKDNKGFCQTVDDTNSIINILKYSPFFKSFEKENSELNNQLKSKFEKIKSSGLNNNNNDNNNSDGLIDELTQLIALIQLGMDNEVIKDEQRQIYNLIYSKIELIKNYNSNNINSLIEEISKLISSLREDKSRVQFSFIVLDELCKEKDLLGVSESVICMFPFMSKQAEAQRTVLKAYLNFEMQEPAEALFSQIEDPQEMRFAVKDLTTWFIKAKNFEKAEILINLLKDTLNDDPASDWDFLKVYLQIDLVRALITATIFKKAEIIASSIKDLQRGGRARHEVLDAYIARDMLKKAESFTSRMQTSERGYAQRKLINAYLDKGFNEDAKRITLEMEIEDAASQD